MTGHIRRGVFAVTAVLLLLAGCTTDSGDEAGVSGAGVGSVNGRAEGGVRPPPLFGPERFAVDVASDRVFFDLDKSDLKPEARERIGRWVAWMKQHSAVSLTIEGHCDERGTREYNLGLGERRAVAVKDYLVSLGIDTRRVTTVSYGKERPAIVGSAETAWSQNRRAVAVAN